MIKMDGQRTTILKVFIGVRNMEKVENDIKKMETVMVGGGGIAEKPVTKFNNNIRKNVQKIFHRCGVC